LGYVGVSNAIETSRRTLRLPGSGPSFTVSLITDVHAPQPRLDFGEVIDANNAARPDLVLIVGDAINRRGDEGLLEMYGPLESRLGKYAVAGNWENWGRVRRSQMKAQYERAGTIWLENASASLPEIGTKLIGLDESTNGWPKWSLVADEPHGEHAVLLLHHSPGAFDELGSRTDRPMLVLSGHTHGGQVAPLGVPLVLPPGCEGYVQGHFSDGPHQMYVSRGIGNSHVPFRIGARPELAILDIERSGGPS
jgi:predicted MPP superfamily phosphohydrolase